MRHGSQGGASASNEGSEVYLTFIWIFDLDQPHIGMVRSAFHSLHTCMCVPQTRKTPQLQSMEAALLNLTLL